MSLDILRSLLRDFGTGIGLPDLAPDDQGYCCLQVGELVKASLQYEPEGQDLVVFARLAEVGPEERPIAHEMMLAGNFFWGQTKGGTLAIDPAEGVVFLQMKEKLRVLDLPGFEALMERFVAAAEAWQGHLQSLTARTSVESAAPVAAGGRADYSRLA
jgi:hypothetical protein